MSAAKMFVDKLSVDVLDVAAKVAPFWMTTFPNTAPAIIAALVFMAVAVFALLNAANFARTHGGHRIVNFWGVRSEGDGGWVLSPSLTYAIISFSSAVLFAATIVQIGDDWSVRANHFCATMELDEGAKKQLTPLQKTLASRLDCEARLRRLAPTSSEKSEPGRT